MTETADKPTITVVGDPNVPIPEHHKQWFSVLLEAAHAGHLALMACRDAKTGEPLSVICAVNVEESGMIGFVPIGHLATTDNPFDAYTPPDTMERVDQADEEIGRTVQ